MPLIGEGAMQNRTETPDETINKSLLKHIDIKTTTEDDLLEAYCRDIDAYSFEFNRQQNNQVMENRQVGVNAQEPQAPKVPEV